MNTFDKIDQLLKENNVKQIDLTNYLGVSKATYTGWKSGRTRSYRKHLAEIAEFFGVTADELLAGEAIERGGVSPFMITERERALIEAFRRNVEMQPAVEKLLSVDAGGEELFTAAYNGGEEEKSVTDKEFDYLLSVKKTPARFIAEGKTGKKDVRRRRK